MYVVPGPGRLTKTDRLTESDSKLTNAVLYAVADAVSLTLVASAESVAMSGFPPMLVIKLSEEPIEDRITTLPDCTKLDGFEYLG
jgi:hypothetical protein